MKMKILVIFVLLLVFKNARPKPIASDEQKEEDLFEGDIVLTDRDKGFVDLRNDGDVDGPLDIVNKRNAQRDRNRLWKTKRVPYEIDPVLGSYMTNINAAIADFTNKTCIRWEPKTAGDASWVKFVQKTGCWSSVGKSWYTGAQELSLGVGCNRKGTIIHEMMHAVGFWHEQSRPDRNQYVKVMWENIKKDKQHNFNKYSHGKVDTLNAPYDYGSLMHYGKYGFSTNGQPTLLPFPDESKDIGQRNGFSKTDIFKLNALYDCTTPNGGWSQWSDFGPCDTSCFHSRQRFCTSEDRATNCPGVNHHGTQEERVQCPDSKCNALVNGHWGRWSSWSACSTTCGKGTTKRARKCDDPTPKNGGKNCQGSDTESNECQQKTCGLAQTFMLCEHKGSDKITCGSGTVIRVLMANYGRTVGGHTCPGAVYTTNCSAGSSLEKVRRSCEGKTTCTLRASNNVFGDPCRGTNKYLEVQYICE